MNQFIQDDFAETLFPARSSLAKFVMPNPRFPLREVIAISFSGGKTSGYMLAMVLRHFRQYEPNRKIVVTFCNTGLEHEETLKFVQRCDEHFNANVVWLEAVVTHGERIGIRHKIVNFETASRNGEPFEEVVKKHGVQNKSYPNCNGRLKVEVMSSYFSSLGISKHDRSFAIGIRSDEIHRVKYDGMLNDGLFYPCADAGVTKRDVNAWWRTQPFNLNIPEHYGNCVTCWKKSDRKLFTIAAENPSAFDFMARMERDYGLAGGERKDGQERQARTFFRKNRSANDILQACKQPFIPFVDGKFIPFDDELDIGGSCGDSCEIGADED